MIKHDDADFHEGLGEPNLGDVVDVQCRPVKHAEDIAFDAVRADRLRMIAKIAKIAEQANIIEALKARLGER